MVKNLENVRWETVALEGLPVSMSDKFQSFVGLEECTDYGLDKDSKKKNKKKKPSKRKQTQTASTSEIPAKKVKLSNGFIVESCTNDIKPSSTNIIDKKSNKQERKDKQKNKFKERKAAEKNNTKSKRLKLGESNVRDSKLSVEDMNAWSEYQIPNEILKALTEQGFQKPTKIQELTLPPAMLGRRDILGAAETGSGKTLAFGIPILAGIMKLKEQYQSGIDIYEMPYKKPSHKKNTNTKEEKSKTHKKVKVKSKKVANGTKMDSSEKGYGNQDSENEKNDLDDGESGSDDGSNNELNGSINDESGSDDEEIVSNDKENGSNDEEDNSVDEENNESNDSNDENSKSDSENEKEPSKEYREEYDVPLRKKVDKDYVDESNDENYIHLSDMLDDDDLVDTTDDEKNDGGEENDDVDDTNGQGIGCVKVIDDVELPHHLVPKTGKPLYALILTPTRELAMQISRHLIAAAKYTGIRIATIVGGMASVKQERVLRSGPEVVVATPGRLWELIRTGETHVQQIDNIKFLAIDETDRMMERNHFEELTPLLERINSDQSKRDSRQNFVFSATLTLVHDLPTHMKGKKVTKRGKIINRKVQKMTSQQKVKRLVDMIGMSDPKTIDITTQNLGTAETLTECRITCSIDQKDHYLYYILKRHPGRTIVFCNSIGSVKRLSQLFTILKCAPLPLHASMPQRQRLKNLERFRDDPHGVLVSTDVAARGLDIPDIDHVVHYQVPRTAENYVHRSGRTARATKEGLTILMMEPGEAHLYSKLCNTLHKQSELPQFPVPSHTLTSMKSIVNLAREVDRLMLGHKRANQEQGWLDKAARDMDIIIDEDFVPQKHQNEKDTKLLQIKKKQLENLLSKPLTPKGFSYKYPTLNDTNELGAKHEENALKVMKEAISSGRVKKEKRRGKNKLLLELEKKLKK